MNIIFNIVGRSSGACYAFQRGECTRGDGCRFSHEGGGGGGGRSDDRGGYSSGRGGGGYSDRGGGYGDRGGYR